MTSAPVPYLTPEQYLEIERKAGFRSEYLRGEMVAMARGNFDHRRIAGETRGDRFHNYRSIATFREQVLIKQEAIRTERRFRLEDGARLLDDIGPTDVIHLESIGCSLTPASLDERVEFAPAV